MIFSFLAESRFSYDLSYFSSPKRGLGKLVGVYLLFHSESASSLASGLAPNRGFFIKTVRGEAINIY